MDGLTDGTIGEVPEFYYGKELMAAVVEDMDPDDPFEYLVSHLKDIAYGVNPIYNAVGVSSDRATLRWQRVHDEAIREAFLEYCAEMGQSPNETIRYYRIHHGRRGVLYTGWVRDFVTENALQFAAGQALGQLGIEY